jgi:lysine-specific demethylase 3
MSHTNDDLLDSPWPIPANVRPRLQKCSRAPDSELPLPKSTVRTGTVKYNHSLTDLQAVSRFTEEQLRTTWVSLVNFVLQPGDDVDVEERLAFLRVRDEEDDLRAAVREWFESHKGKRQRSSPSQSTPSEDEIKALYDASVDLPQVEDPAELGSQPFLFIENDRLDNATFDQLWARGEPLVVNKVTANMRLTWNPELFIERFGPEQCYVLNCKTEKVSTMTIGQFFTLLGDHTRSKVYTPPYVPPPPSPPAAPRAAGARQSSRARKAVTYTAPEENDDSRERENAETGSQRGGTPASARRAGSEASGPANGNGNREEGDEDVDNLPPPRKITKSVLKLKDWPCTNDFSTAYPELYEDFCRALPVPDFTGRNGVLNLYSHVRITGP